MGSANISIISFLVQSELNISGSGNVIINCDLITNGNGGNGGQGPDGGSSGIGGDANGGNSTLINISSSGSVTINSQVMIGGNGGSGGTGGNGIVNGSVTGITGYGGNSNGGDATLIYITGSGEVTINSEVMTGGAGGAGGNNNNGSIEILELLSGYITNQEIASNIVVMAAEKNQEDITNYMIENFNVNPDYAIASAALEGNFALMERLDPSPEILTKVLDLALRSDRFNIVNYLLSIGAKPRGDTIALATRMGNLDLFNRLLQASGYTLDEYLIWLVKNNKTDQIKFLLDNNLTDRDVVAALSNHESY